MLNIPKSCRFTVKLQPFSQHGIIYKKGRVKCKVSLILQLSQRLCRYLITEAGLLCSLYLCRDDCLDANGNNSCKNKLISTLFNLSEKSKSRRYMKLCQRISIDLFRTDNDELTLQIERCNCSEHEADSVTFLPRSNLPFGKKSRA